MHNQRFYLGIDGGGTKTTAAIVDAEGTECGRGSGGPGNLVNTRPETLRQSLRDAVQSACQNAQLPEEVHFNGVCAGMAGYSAEAKRAAFATLLASEVNANTHHVEPDFSIAYWGATCGEPGIIVIAGTGAVAYGRNADGETRREDGLGFLLGDRGSGFNLGLRVLQYTLELWKAGDHDALTEAVLAHTGAPSQEQIVQWLYGDFSPARVAALAPVVGQLAQDGEPAACWHVADMARRLRHSVRQVRHHLWLPRETPVYPLGGLWNLGEFFREEFAEPRWSGEGRFVMPLEGLTGGRFVTGQPRSDAAFGAALLAQVKDTLVQTVET
jgi:glucosamine kinase